MYISENCGVNILRWPLAQSHLIAPKHLGIKCTTCDVCGGGFPDWSGSSSNSFSGENTTISLLNRWKQGLRFCPGNRRIIFGVAVQVCWSPFHRCGPLTAVIDSWSFSSGAMAWVWICVFTSVNLFMFLDAFRKTRQLCGLSGCYLLFKM